MQKNYGILMAKTGKEAQEEWLPLWMHLRDTAGIMKCLVQKWTPKAVFCAANLEYEPFLKAAIFLAAVHDIGKATSYFQSVITKSCGEKYEEITGRGFVVNKVYRAEGRTPHSYAGQWILQSDTTGFGVPQSLAMVVGAHHGRPMDLDPVDEEPDMILLYPVNFYGKETGEEAKAPWKEAWQDIFDQALKLAGLRTVGELPVLTMEAQILLSGLLIMADWIASNAVFLPLLALDEYGDESLYPKRVLDGWKRADFPQGWESNVNQMDEAEFEKRFIYSPNEVQRHMLEAVNQAESPGIFILEAQMGIGKTEAALGAAEVLSSRKQEGGIFYGLPTQATSNGLFPRLYQWAEKVSENTVNAVRLAHGSAKFHEEYYQLFMKGKAQVDEDGQSSGKMVVNAWFQGNKRALLADFVLGTVDQFLMASLRRKHFMLRHVGLAGKVVVIDECHAYDAYMNEYLERSLQWMAAYGVPVILLSATLPFDRRRALTECYVKAYARYHLKKKKPDIAYMQPGWERNTAYPLLTWTDGETVRQVTFEQKVREKTVRVRYVDSVPEMIRLLEDKLKEGGCACIIVNTVKAAQKIYEECQKQMEQVHLVLYHAQFTMPDRYEKERELLKKMGKDSSDKDRNRLILIGTQVLEQSLDYDADIMVTQLCPMDLLLQRMGRLHRHEREGGQGKGSRPGRLKNPECILLREGEDTYDKGTRAIYGDYLLMRTRKLLPETIKIPGDISPLVQKVYDAGDDLGLTGKTWQVEKERYEGWVKGKKKRAKSYLLEKPSSKVMQGMLENAENSSDKAAEAGVRDAASSIEILLMKRETDGEVLFVKEEAGESSVLWTMEVPDNIQGRRIAMQRLKLPHALCMEYNKYDTIKELEEMNRRELAQWQLCPWLQGELIFLLDQENRGELNGYLLHYSFEKGLEYERKEKMDGGEGV